MKIYYQIDIQSQIREIISEKLNESNSNQKLTQDLIVQEIRKKGIVDSLMNGIKFENQIFQSNQEKPAKLPAANNNHKTTPKFLDKTLDYAVPLTDKGKH